MVDSQALFTWYYNSSLNDPITILFIAIISFGFISLIYWYMNLKDKIATVTASTTSSAMSSTKSFSKTGWNWLYATNNSNAGILFAIILLLIIC